MGEPAEFDSRFPGIVPAFVERLPRILTEVRDRLADRHQDYASFLTSEFDEVVAAAAGFAGRLVGGAAEAEGGGLEQELFEEIGRRHFGEGRDLTELLTAYRVGAAVAWRHVAQLALGLGASSEALAALASSVFTAVDRLSSASLRGYTQEQAESVLARDRHRDELAALLLSDRSGSSTIRAAAAQAQWRLPEEAAVVLVDADNNTDTDITRATLARLEPDCLRLRGPWLWGAIVPDPGGPAARTRLARCLRGIRAVVGVGVTLDGLPASLRVAEVALRLRRTGLLSDDPLFVGEHLDALIVHHDEPLLAALRRRHLAPLDQLPEASRQRLLSTLTSWLLQMGNRQAMAAELHVHPQTVRYRMAQVRELFGPVLDDPAERATLLLALAWGPADGEARRGGLDPPSTRPMPAPRAEHAHPRSVVRTARGECRDAPGPRR